MQPGAVGVRVTRPAQIVLLLLSGLLATLGGVAAMLAVVVALASRPDPTGAAPRLADAIAAPTSDGER